MMRVPEVQYKSRYMLFYRGTQANEIHIFNWYCIMREGHTREHSRHGVSIAVFFEEQEKHQVTILR